ncbi:unnamed protein product [Dovyalis caffra]|uniref:Uncharacterized protein n=1 Tax=Dovyalis caffra TaxID=77055 RepID=A0AAV1R316_9ROSI|nr:unnamed protein product [Dovyalis caffra]
MLEMVVGRVEARKKGWHEHPKRRGDEGGYVVWSLRGEESYKLYGLLFGVRVVWMKEENEAETYIGKRNEGFLDEKARDGGRRAGRFLEKVMVNSKKSQKMHRSGFL